MASRGMCKHEAAQQAQKLAHAALVREFRDVPYGPLVMGATPHCPRCAYEAGREWWERVKAEAERKAAEPPMYAGPLPEPPP